MCQPAYTIYLNELLIVGFFYPVSYSTSKPANSVRNQKNLLTLFPTSKSPAATSNFYIFFPEPIIEHIFGICIAVFHFLVIKFYTRNITLIFIPIQPKNCFLFQTPSFSPLNAHRKRTATAILFLLFFPSI